MTIFWRSPNNSRRKKGLVEKHNAKSLIISKMAAMNIRYLFLLQRRLISYYYFRRRLNKQPRPAKRRCWVRKLYEERNFIGEFEFLIFLFLYKGPLVSKRHLYCLTAFRKISLSNSSSFTRLLLWSSQEKLMKLEQYL